MKRRKKKKQFRVVVPRYSFKNNFTGMVYLGSLYGSDVGVYPCQGICNENYNFLPQHSVLY